MARSPLTHINTHTYQPHPPPFIALWVTVFNTLSHILIPTLVSFLYICFNVFPLFLYLFSVPQTHVAAGSGEPGADEYHSLVLYHNNSPRWAEQIKLPIPVDMFRGSHVRFEFRHCSSKWETGLWVTFIYLGKDSGVSCSAGNAGGAALFSVDYPGQLKVERRCCGAKTSSHLPICLNLPVTSPEASAK